MRYPLTDEGIQGAKDAGKALSNIPFDIAISSDLKELAILAIILSTKIAIGMSCNTLLPHFLENSSMVSLKE